MEKQWKKIAATSRSIIKLVKEYAVIGLFRWKKQIASGLIVISVLLLLTLINTLMPHNSAWLQGKWFSQSVNYSFKPGNEAFTSWTIKCRNKVALKQAKVAVNSTKKCVVMTDDGNNIEYHATRTGRKQLELKIVRDGQSDQLIELSKK
ncbi:hypothetical protein [Enterococcus gilvus]|uniref:Uncharacterized protein n=1 Tax=Enterococcus gilvus ATCC BAA-350 TaxID=1158614 RepID=R2XG53_9ENTE|nr:hypothetical protein [Enterococcus gilvus]EOI53598.1 hypothetical protein UKC_03550 [Enterococcus gilvus ATCC BAA-350]EOW81127.1 hypothetical protein I592_00412 [Enterococcus gilvus ATCC BAA-350]OJG42916.1 hypothetical protein RV02_GL003384 [Enterococcus gilvus]